MALSDKKWNSSQLQALFWLVIFTLHLVGNLQYDPAPKAFAYAVLTLCFYGVIIYGNTYWLIPRLYQRHHRWAYGAAIFLLLAVTTVIRTFLALRIANSAPNHEPNTLTPGMFAYGGFSALWVFIFSILYRLTLNYFPLMQREKAIQAEKTEAELRLLKQQIHPHFLFNTLNNIYYEAQKKSPEAADLIERLSEIMRYFMEESLKDRVSLRHELDLLNSYIELENVRMRHGMPVQFTTTGPVDTTVLPPLLLLPLVENIFKHGVDKRSSCNFARIDLEVSDNRVHFTTENPIHNCSRHVSERRSGLANLKKRLDLYFRDQYVLQTRQSENSYIAHLEFPLYGY